jgi:hypothetical protein
MLPEAVETGTSPMTPPSNAPAKPAKTAPAPKKGTTSASVGAYDRFGLIGNPFRDLASESLSDVEIFHVNLSVDESLAPIKEEVFAKENKTVVAIIGNQGAGKTERLLLASSEGTARGAFVVYYDISEKISWVLPGLAQKLMDGAQLGGFAKIFSPPAWYRALAPLAKPPVAGKGYDPIQAGKALAAALNARAPSFLLLNDLHNLATVPEADAFAKTLQELFDSIRPGVLVMFGSFPGYFVALSKKYPALVSRINRTVFLPTLSTEEAGLLLAKKLLAKRLVESLDPLYPFDRPAVEALNASAMGNPRRLLELSDRALEYAAAHRSYRITADLVRIALAPRVATPPVPGAVVLPPPAPASAGASTPQPS